MHPVGEYMLLLASYCSFLFVHLASISPNVPAQFKFYFEYEFFLVIFVTTCLARVKKKVLAGDFRLVLAPREMLFPTEYPPDTLSA